MAKIYFVLTGTKYYFADVFLKQGMEPFTGLNAGTEHIISARMPADEINGQVVSAISRIKVTAKAALGEGFWTG